MRKKILIIRFSSIGDIVLTTPIVRCIKLQLPDVELHYLTKKVYASILTANPHIDKVIVLEKHLHDLLRIIAAEKYDYVIDLHKNLRSGMITSNLQLSVSSFDKLNFRKWVMVRFKKNILPDTHIVQRYLEAAAVLGVMDDGDGLEYYIPKEDEITITEFPETHRNGYDAVVIGAAHFTKKLPVEKLIELCNRINNPIILVGGKEDTENGNLIAITNKNIWNACGLFSINTSASIIQQSNRVFTHDTGMMHIAAAFQKPIISFWGNTIPEFGMYPYYGKNISLDMLRKKNQIMEVKGLYCRPCSKIGFEKCPQKHFKCMREIDLDSIS
ncbi:MAG: glycosyltransferase family 9 protein [Bacteroidetes bacterium]|nr:glycosyltransferase family 9 protein [Bacteroidota bacterium]MBP7399943.1 glycosyltransferase family 9 protein [Chitinophagales bacterium]MBK7110349.1 glycosyltransferase family 9 protein [Bacteroidota bacterium]MBK8488366.1 glycosyltransferase family 9 protein [Bacteroidota bacterium]MBK8681870.1 glycosyltransferase family 9 protein [Bacteroidota bacterium]